MAEIFAVNKPKGPTSHDVVAIIKKKTGQKVGHAGTLDPLASGVLVVGVGREATKQLADIVKKEKEYIADIKLGETSTTDDAEGEKVEFQMSNVKVPKQEEVKNVLLKFVGTIQQVPPTYSAVKVEGQKAYRQARRGQPLELKARSVEIKRIDLLEYRYPRLKLQVITGPGVYIRSLARDLGQVLQTGGYLADLVRTRVGNFTLENAQALKNFK